MPLRISALVQMSLWWTDGSCDGLGRKVRVCLDLLTTNVISTFSFIGMQMSFCHKTKQCIDDAAGMDQWPLALACLVPVEQVGSTFMLLCLEHCS